jgi:prolipoprotein diacylglyceryltransferase
MVASPGPGRKRQRASRLIVPMFPAKDWPFRRFIGPFLPLPNAAIIADYAGCRIEPAYLGWSALRAQMNGTLLHIAFDAIAWLTAGLSLVWLTKCTNVRFPAAPTGDLTYIAALIFGAGIGAVLFGTANLWLSHQAGIARSIEGAIAGAIVAVELYKRLTGVTVRTGARFALPLAVGVAVGRIGCFLSGVEDFTHGTPTALPWGHDFGDGIMRHPVQLYESAAMAAFAVFYVWRVRRAGERSERPARQLLKDARERAGDTRPETGLVGARHNDRFVIDNGFYLAVGFYGAQRFLWEFIKPYGTLIGPFTLFHLLSAAIVAYAVVMIATAPTPRPIRKDEQHDRAFA